MRPQRRTLLLFGIIFFVHAFALENGLGRVPQMGWNSWNHYGCNISEALIRDTAVALVKSGLIDAGYTYLNLDDCWAAGRYLNGTVYPDPKAFPSGMKSLADYVHSLGLKFGLYSDAGQMTCQRRPGGLGHEQVDANTYAAWGVDYLKYDNCWSNFLPPEQRYPPMQQALNSTGRQIFFSMCEWGVDQPATWAPKLANSWRTTTDIVNDWYDVLSNLDQNDQWWKYAAPGGWNDPDMLEVGNGVLSDVESRAHFSLWCLVKAPLIIGCDVSNISQDTLDILTAPEVIAVNQDPLGVQGHKVNASGAFGCLQVWAAPMSDGSIVVALFNRCDADAQITAYWSDIGLPNSTVVTVRDLWARQDYIGTYSQEFSAGVGTHGVVLVKMKSVS